MVVIMPVVVVMMMVVVVPVIMCVVMRMVVVMMVVVARQFQTAHAGAEGIAQIAVLDVGAGGVGALALHVVVM